MGKFDKVLQDKASVIFRQRIILTILLIFLKNCSRIIKYGQLTQLVECLRHMEKVRGSSPLLPTTGQFDAPLYEGVFRKRLLGVSN